MKLIIIRHADPDYSVDSLTPTGWREAELLSRRIAELDVKDFYVSPLGRAKDTAKLTLERMGREAVELDWLREFPAKVNKPGKSTHSCAWDWLPADWTRERAFYDRNEWMNVPVFAEADMKAIYQNVVEGLDKLLESYGYLRDGNYYRVQSANEDTVVLFCHFGVECVLLSHLLGVSPMVLWHGFAAAPSSVTVLNTEERRRGVAYFRTACFGDISHLYVSDQEPSFACRFCETYDNSDQRHD